jgi:hypothetical protein
MDIRDILSIGGEENVEPPGFARVLGVDWDHQCRCMESTVGALEKISSEGNWELRNSPTTHGLFYPCGGTSICVKRPKCITHAHHP